MKRGTTLAEVLVAILIIVILASLTLATYSGARRSTGVAVCASNMRQLYVAMKLYQEDYGEYPPINSQDPRFPGFTTIVQCPDSIHRHKPEPGWDRFDYTLLGWPLRMSMVSDQDVQEALRRCREIRQSDIPLVLDENHAPQMRQKSDTVSKIYVVREHGGMDSMSISSTLTAEEHCDSTKLSSHYNY
jgi:type II secretory pathway pseudopilin PulG